MSNITTATTTEPNNATESETARQHRRDPDWYASLTDEQRLFALAGENITTGKCHAPTDPDPDDEWVLINRAANAWGRGRPRGWCIALSDIKVEEANGRRYVVRRNVSDIIACFRVRNDGRLKSLRRIPAELRDR
jgi:hypothetical protein